MAVYVRLTKLSSASLRAPQELEELEKKVMDRTKTECPEVAWQDNFAVLGLYDYLDIFEAPDNDSAKKVATIIRTHGHASTGVWPAKKWRDYKEMIRRLPAGHA
jgi:uncharacterized protein with GYD domain